MHQCQSTALESDEPPEQPFATGGSGSIDGSKFKAVNNRDRNFTVQRIKSRMQHLERAVQQYLDDLDRADREPAAVPEARVSQLQGKIAAIKAEMRKLANIKEQLPKPGGQISLTDPDGPRAPLRRAAARSPHRAHRSPPTRMAAQMRRLSRIARRSCDAIATCFGSHSIHNM
jgi:hypothetical protein